MPALRDGSEIEGHAIRHWALSLTSPARRWACVPVKDKWVSAKFLADILNLAAWPEWGQFVWVKTVNGVTLDFEMRGEFRLRHYAFRVSDAEFDAAFACIRAQDVRY
jgi:hypothetical protein